MYGPSAASGYQTLATCTIVHSLLRFTESPPKSFCSELSCVSSDPPPNHTCGSAIVPTSAHLTSQY